jgi:phosphoribosylamine-glycine ligase
MADGKNVSVLATSQDHKRLLDGDEGPNTGGMGAYSPAPVVTPNVHAKAMHEIIQPTLAGMAKDGIPFTGFLYAGLMIDAQGNPKTLEFNCRMGDPETQPIMMRLKSDLIDVIHGRHRWHLGLDRSSCNGTVVSHWAWSWPQVVTHWTPKRATSSPACLKILTTPWCSMLVPSKWMARSSPAVAVSCV